ncbi:hypothetical protein B0T20DRAFT_347517 [Sordaria brevicollis]|uniref:Methyltransferase domain-containing protein n=1 Tax=Sordaria brevicollis TaxID=83679 RepID=A0AAE0UER1_SORBR|nr:hypothetical protein B0T20DRAFT_347517 [Sordaria brevicollis]
MTATFTSTSTGEEDAKIATLLAAFPHDPSLAPLVFIPRFRQRLSILSAWSIPPGSRVLDIGCGQGDSSLVLALELGPDCHVTGIDTAPPSYGTPLTVSESQSKILQSVELGSRLAFYNETDAAGFFSFHKGVKLDAATACHSLFYFPSQLAVACLFRELAGQNIKRVYVAEYDQQDLTFPVTQTPHVLTAKAQAMYFAYKAEADEIRRSSSSSVDDPEKKEEMMPLNVRAAPSIASIISAAKEAGYGLTKKGKFTPKEEYQEGHFEARYVKGERFVKRVREEGRLTREREEEILAVVEEVRRAWEVMEREGGVDVVRCMDVWWGVFELEE